MTYKEMSKELKEIAKTYNRSLQDLIVNGAQIKEGFLFDPSKRNDEYAFFQFKGTNSSTINAERFVLSVNFALTCLKLNIEQSYGTIISAKQKMDGGFLIFLKHRIIEIDERQ